MDYTYIKVPPGAAQTLGLTEYRRQCKDGDYIINQDDLQTYGTPEDTLQTKINRLGGKAITAGRAKYLLSCQ